MTTGILIIAHAPLASALRGALLHVFPEAAACTLAMDVPADAAPDASLAQARQLMAQLATPRTLVLSDVFGATPCNVAQRLVDGVDSRLVVGVNLPMLLRTVNYRHEDLDALVSRAMVGGTQGILQVAVTAPQNQKRQPHDQHHDHHSQ